MISSHFCVKNPLKIAMKCAIINQYVKMYIEIEHRDLLRKGFRL